MCAAAMEQQFRSVKMRVKAWECMECSMSERQRSTSTPGRVRTVEESGSDEEDDVMRDTNDNVIQNRRSSSSSTAQSSRPARISMLHDKPVVERRQVFETLDEDATSTDAVTNAHSFNCIDKHPNHYEDDDDKDDDAHDVLNTSDFAQSALINENDQVPELRRQSCVTGEKLIRKSRHLYECFNEYEENKISIKEKSQIESRRRQSTSINNVNQSTQEICYRIQVEENLFQTRTKYKSFLDDQVDVYQRQSTLKNAKVSLSEECSDDDDDDDREYYNTVNQIIEKFNKQITKYESPETKVRRPWSNGTISTLKESTRCGKNPSKSPIFVESTRDEVDSVTSSEIDSMENVTLTKRLVGSGPNHIFWINMLEVKELMRTTLFSEEEVKLQEAQFELITSEASYFKSLGVLVHHFYYAEEFSAHNPRAVISPLEKQHLFSNILQVYQVSENFLKELEGCWLQNPVIHDICSIVLRFVCGGKSIRNNNVEYPFKAYLIYCRNQTYQSRSASELEENNKDYCATIRRLETDSICRHQKLISFLLLPMQRIVRLKMLVEQIVKRLPDPDTKDALRTQQALKALGALQHLVQQCNEEARRMADTENLVRLQQRLDFHKTRPLGIIGDSRKILKEATLKSMHFSSSGTLRFLRSKMQLLHMIVLSDHLLITKPKNDERLQVLDHRPRSWVKARAAKDLQETKLCFEIILYKSCNEDKLKTYLFEVDQESDQARWISILQSYNKDFNDNKSFNDSDCEQVKVIKPYKAKEADELTLNIFDIINVIQDVTCDGWCEGWRSADGMRGWFPATYTEKIQNEYHRAKFAKQSFRRNSAKRAFQETQICHRSSKQSDCLLKSFD